MKSVTVSQPLQKTVQDLSNQAQQIRSNWTTTLRAALSLEAKQSMPKTSGDFQLTY